MFENDEFTCDIDALGYKQQADTLRELILLCQTPYAIGISGRWGSGKTSLMKYIMASLHGKPLTHRLQYQDKAIKNIEECQKFLKVTESYDEIHHIVPIWFNPWEHENHDEPFIELLKEIHHFFSTTILLAESKKIAHTTVRAGLDILGTFLKMGRNPASHAQQLGEQYEHQHFAYTHRSQQFKLLFQEAVETLLCGVTGAKKGTPLVDNARLIIFIDDLDRCEDTVIGQLLKDIKQHLSTKYCVFVFGYDRHHIEKALCQNADRSPKESRAYLEKLFQSTVYIKQPNAEKLKTYIQHQLAPDNSPIDFVGSKHRDGLAAFLSQILDPNPRRIKAFFTTFYLHVKTNTEFQGKQDLSEQDLKRLALLAYLKLFYEPVYAALENDHTLLVAMLAMFRNASHAAIDSLPKCFVYLEMKSHLSTTDDVPEDEQRASILKDNDSEQKFLKEVNEMQGKHKSFYVFKQEFEICFHDMVETDNMTQNICPYL